MVKQILLIIIYTTCLIFIGTSYSGATWQGPTDVVIGVWGTGPGQFGVEYEDYETDFPKSIGISKSARLVVADPFNEVLHVFDSNGSFLLDIAKPVSVQGWPYSLDAVKDECVVVGYAEFTHTFNVGSGKLIGVANNMDGVNYVTDDCAKIYSEGKSGWKVYSPTGQILQTFATRPPELGRWSSTSQTGGGYRHILAYPDRTYSYVLPWKTLNGYQRDSAGNLVVVALADPTPMVYKVSPCGKIVGQVQIPASKGHVVGTMGKDVVKKLDYEFGQPVIAQNGDVYTWKRTPTHYSILKWTWVDDPNTPSGPDAPSGLTVTPSTKGLYLTWTASPGDPDCVTSYEISRATSAGGAGTTVGTVPAGTVTYNDSSVTTGTTYYYKVRAVSGSEFSPYTSEVSGKK